MPQALFMCVGRPASRHPRRRSCRWPPCTVRMSSALLIHVCAPSSGSNGLLLSMVASCAAFRPDKLLLLTFPPPVGILFAEGFGEVTSECVSAEKEVLLITFFFCTSSRSYRYDLPSASSGSEAYRHRPCSGLWLFCVQDRNGEYGTAAQVIAFCGVCPCRWHPPAAAGAHIPRRACPVC